MPEDETAIPKIFDLFLFARLQARNGVDEVEDERNRRPATTAIAHRPPFAFRALAGSQSLAVRDSPVPSGEFASPSPKIWPGSHSPASRFSVAHA